MASTLKLFPLVPLMAASFFACTAGGDVVPEADEGTAGTGGGGSTTAGSNSTGTSGTSTGTSGSASMTAGTGSMSGGAGGTAGGSGPTTTAGTDSTGGSAVTGGTGGAGVMEEDPYEAVKVLDAWRVDMACTNDPNKNFLSPNCQQGGDICNMKDDNGGRTSFTLNKKIGGDANKLYKFRVRIRGVVEPKAFDPAKCPPLFEGPNVPMRTCKCVTPDCIPIESGFNWMRLDVSAPVQRFWINNAKDVVNHRVEILDGQFDMEVRGQADIEYFFDNINTGEIRNCQNKLAPGLPFYEGNFFVIDIIPGSVTAAVAP